MAKRALCVGINDYPGTNQDLTGCVNDANDWKAALEARGYTVSMLLDGQATRAGMVAALHKLFHGATDDDTLMFTYSGHGSWLPDDNGDEADQRDEMLCPHDVASQQFLLDDDLNEIFALKPKKARLFFISDSCHSGSVAKFQPQIGDRQNARPKLLPPLNFVKDPAIREKILDGATGLTKATRQNYPALLLGGCKDIEVSYDASFGGRPNGALTYVALKALKTGPASPRQWHRLVRQQLPSMDYPQTPQLYGGRTAKDGPMF
jgi:hypothetical protein